jgi:dTDP-glucose pyrophosphorylase
MARESSSPLPVVEAHASLREAVEVIEARSASICLLIDPRGRLLGSLSDGDVRRAFLAGADLDDLARDWARSAPTTVPIGTDRSAVLDLMRALSVPQVPEVDGEGRVTRLHLLREIIGSEPRPNSAVILAGGRGTRLRAVLGDLPKPMVSVAGRPILERLVLHLVGAGITDIYLAVGYRAEVIEQHFGDGAAFGCRITYLHETEPRGTAGPLRDLVGSEAVGDPMIVLNGDLVTSFSVSSLLSTHGSAGARMTIAVTDYAHEVPYGVLLTEGPQRRVTGLEEKPTWIGTVNAGVYVIEPDVLERIPRDRPVPMTEVIEGCLQRGETVIAWQVVGDWHDVGRPEDLAVAKGEA